MVTGKQGRPTLQQVRGTFEGNSFVSEIEEHITKKTTLGDELISRMEKLR